MGIFEKTRTKPEPKTFDQALRDAIQCGVQTDYRYDADKEDEVSFETFDADFAYVKVMEVLRAYGKLPASYFVPENVGALINAPLHETLIKAVCAGDLPNNLRFNTEDTLDSDYGKDYRLNLWDYDYTEALAMEQFSLITCLYTTADLRQADIDLLQDYGYVLTYTEPDTSLDEIYH